MPAFAGRQAETPAPLPPGAGSRRGSKICLPNRLFLIIICSMNIDHSTLPETDFPRADPNQDQAAQGFGQDDADDPAWLKRRATLLERLAERGVDVADELPALARAQSGLAEAVTE